METPRNRDALESLKNPRSRPYLRSARSQCREIANTINVDLISLRAAIWKNPRTRNKRGRRIGRDERSEEYWWQRRMLLAVAAAARRRRNVRMIGKRISQCTRSERFPKTDDRLLHRLSIDRIVSCLKDSLHTSWGSHGRVSRRFTANALKFANRVRGKQRCELACNVSIWREW